MQLGRRSAWRTTRTGWSVPRIGLHVSDRWLSVAMAGPALVVMLGYLTYPVWNTVSSAFMQWDTLSAPGVWVGFTNFNWALNSPEARDSFGHSVYYTVASVVLQVAFGMALALLLNENLPGRNIARALILFPFVVPGVVAAIAWRYMFNDLTGVVNYILLSAHLISQPIGWLSTSSKAMNTMVLVSSWKFVPFSVIIFLARLQVIPVDLIEAARCDGAGPWQIFRHIVWPWMMPVVMIAMTLRTIWTFNDFDLPYLLTQGGPLNSTQVLPVLIRNLMINDLDFGRAAAVSVLMLLILMVMSFLYLFIYRRSERLLHD